MIFLRESDEQKSQCSTVFYNLIVEVTNHHFYMLYSIGIQTNSSLAWERIYLQVHLLAHYWQEISVSCFIGLSLRLCSSHVVGMLVCVVWPLKPTLGVLLCHLPGAMAWGASLESH